MNDHDDQHSSDQSPIPRLLKEIHEQTPIPDGEMAWLAFQNVKKAQQHQRLLKRRWISGVTAASFLIFILCLTGGWNPVYALPNVIALVVKKAQDGAVHVFFGQDSAADLAKAKTGPPPDGIGPMEPSTIKEEVDANPGMNNLPPLVMIEPNLPDVVTKEAAIAKLTFPLPQPDLPEGMFIEKIEIRRDKSTGMHNSVTIRFTNYERRSARLTAYTINPGSFKSVTSFGGSGEIVEIMLNGHKGALYTYSGISHLEWIAGHIRYEINGFLTKTEIVKAAESIK